MKVYKGKEALTAPDGTYLVYWEEGEHRYSVSPVFMEKNEEYLFYFGIGIFCDMEGVEKIIGPITENDIIGGINEDSK